MKLRALVTLHTGNGVIKRGEVFCDQDHKMDTVEVNRLVARKFAEIVDAQSEPKIEPEPEPEQESFVDGGKQQDLVDLTRAELTKIAADMGVNITTRMTKDDIVAAIKAVPVVPVEG